MSKLWTVVVYLYSDKEFVITIESIQEYLDLALQRKKLCLL